MLGLGKERQNMLTEAKGLTCLPSLTKQVGNDSRRCVANINLNKSMAAWMVHKARGEEPDWLKAGAETLPASPRTPLSKEASRRNCLTRRASAMLLEEPSDETGQAMVLTRSAARETRVLGRRTSLNAGNVCLQAAYRTHVAGFVKEGDNRVSVEELIIILNRCKLFDEHFTPDKVRNHCSTWADGCNKAHQVKALGLDGIGPLEFEHLLRWASDVKCIEFRLIVQKVVRLAKKVADQAGTVQQKLEFVFDACGHQANNHMSAFEFGNLCRRLNLSVSMGDVILVFNKQPGGLQEGIDFGGFINVLKEIGEKLGIGDEAYNLFAHAQEFLGTKDKTLLRLQARLRRAAVIVMGEEWKSFLKKFVRREAQTIDWAEFVSLCRDTLHLQERDSHLEILFDHLDTDANGEFPIQTLIDFLDQEAAPPS
mmetsp:Transcript_112598/g.303988  ORF Transcript_112598/g.303988 Transcript_112598/m.303988 type:complete len:425 (-) Transcript_112598:191-1465(-)